MITEPKIEHRNEQPYMGIRAQVTMQELGKVLPPLWGEVYGWLASKGVKPAGAPLWRYLVTDPRAEPDSTKWQTSASGSAETTDAATTGTLKSSGQTRPRAPT